MLHLILQELQAYVCLSNCLNRPILVFVGYKDLQVFLTSGNLKSESFIPNRLDWIVSDLACFNLLIFNCHNHKRLNTSI